MQDTNNNPATVRCDFFWRRYNRNAAKMFSDTNVVELLLQVPAADAMDLGKLLAAAYAAGASKGTFQSGIFQIQTDLGIWSRPDDRRVGIIGQDGKLSGAGKTSFKTWAQLESEEIAQGT